MRRIATGLRRVLLVLVDPAGAQAAAIGRPDPLPVAAALSVLAILIGLATLPRQLDVLAVALSASGDGLTDARNAIMRPGLVRLMLVDRLVPSPTLLFSAVLVVVVAEPLLVLSRERRPALWVMALLGLAPLLVERLGQLAITYLVTLPVDTAAGIAVTLPHRFATGVRLAWHGIPPAWVELLDDRLNLIILWSLVLWTIGLRHLDGGGRLQAWHVLVPASCLIGAGLATWVLGSVAVTLVLRGL